MIKWWSAKRKRKRQKRPRAEVFGTRPLMEYVQEKIARDREELPRLCEKAVALGLSPQPWWDVDFCKWVIRQRKKEGR